MRNLLLKSRNQKAVSKKMEKQVTFQLLSRIKQMTRILRNTGTTCLCQTIVLGNRLLHLLFWVKAFKIIFQFQTSSPKRAFCFLITVEITIRQNRATFNFTKRYIKSCAESPIQNIISFCATLLLNNEMKIVHIYLSNERSIFSLTAWHKLLILSL